MDVTDYQGTVAAKIAEYGWMIQGVGPGLDYPQFAYTIGLTELGHPELMMIGLQLQTMHTLLNDMARPVKAGRRYEPGERVQEIIVDLPVLIHGPIDPEAARLIQAMNLYGQIEALQVLWPDTQGRFPGEPGFPSHFAEAQPVMAHG